MKVKTAERLCYQAKILREYWTIYDIMDEKPALVVTSTEEQPFFDCFIQSCSI